MIAKLLTIIIVTFKSIDVIDSCLTSIVKYNDIGESLEVIVIDNSPIGDKTYEHVATKYEWVRTIKNNSNKGFGQGNNVGAGLASGKYLLFLNPDTILVEPIFDFVISNFEQDLSLSAAGLLMVSREGRYVNSFGFLPEAKGVLPTILFLPLIKYFGVTPRNIYPWGANLFVRKYQFEEAGRFDENIFLCYEEPDLVKRLKRFGRTKIMNKSLIHLDGHTTNNREHRLSESLISEKYYFEKYNFNYIKYVRQRIFALKVKFFLLRVVGGNTTDCKLLINLYKNQLRGMTR